MGKHVRLELTAINEKYSSQEIRSRIVDLLDLQAFLSYCVIESNYKISDDLNNAIVPSAYGNQLLIELGKSVPVKEARLICFLDFFHYDLLIDPQAMDPEKLARAIGQELVDGRIRLPFIHGPELYRRAASLFPDERTYLSHQDTIKLLDEQPIGVFQMGRWICGPLGMISGLEERVLRPTLRIPLQHCHDVTCSLVHPVRLSTDQQAVINQERSVVSRALDAHGVDPAPFPVFFSELFDDSTRAFDDYNAGAIGLLLGEGISTSELRNLVLHLLNDTGGELRKRVGIEGDARKWITNKTRAELLQTALVTSNRWILQILDRMIFAGDLVIPDGEVRRPVLSRPATAGAFAVSPELSNLGVRLRAQSLGPLRLRRLVDLLYSVSSEGSIGDSQQISDAEELGWQLRGSTGITLLTRLDEYLRTVSPEEAVRRLVLVRKENVEDTCKHLGLALDDELDDSTLVNRILWKLGFDAGSTDSPIQRFWEKHDKFSQSARAASVSTIVDQETMRGLSVNYFVALEEVLSDSLAFSAWVLLSDHVTNGNPYFYDPSNDARESFEILTNFAADICPDGREPLRYSDKATLRPLCEGFGLLSKLLRAKLADRSSLARPREGFPRFAGKTDLKSFPFRHVCVFLDLTPASQSNILRLLSEVSKDMMAANVPDVRNEQLHFRRSSTDLDRLWKCLSAIKKAVTALEDAGLARVTFYPDRSERDRWRRSTVYFSDRRGKEIAFGMPSSYDWLNLPSLSRSQYLVSCAQFAEPNEVLRIGLGPSSEFSSMWADLPMRRLSSRRADGAGTSSAENSHGTSASAPA